MISKVLDFNTFKLTEIYTKLQALLNENTEYNLKIKDIIKRINRCRNSAFNNQIQVEVEVETLESGLAKFEISYFTMFASWSPVYDVRVIDVSKPIDINMKASLIQNTGEDWKEVVLSVSNGRPTNSESYPNINPWYLGYYQYRANNNVGYNPDIKYISGEVKSSSGEPIIGANIVLKEFYSIGTITDIDGKYYLPIAKGAKNVVVSYTGYETQEATIQNENMNFTLSEGKLLEEIVVTGYAAGISPSASIPKDKILRDINTTPVNISYQPTTFSYDMKEKVTLPNSTSMVIVDILAHQIPTIYNYYTVPKYDKSVFLTAAIVGWQDYNLLDGKFNLYLEGRYLGQSILQTKTAGDTLQISLGRDQGVIVERTKVKEFAKKSFLSGNTTEIRAFVISIKNNKDQKIRIKMQDHLPISTDKAIEVFDFEAKSGFINPDSRIVTWEIELNPRSEQSKEIKYSVKYPSTKRLELD